MSRLGVVVFSERTEGALQGQIKRLVSDLICDPSVITIQFQTLGYGLHARYCAMITWPLPLDRDWPYSEQ